MVAVHLITTPAHKETAKQAILKQLREAGAISPAIPISLKIDSDEAEQAVSELLEAGTIRLAKPGLYFIDESKRAEGQAGLGFKLLLIMLVMISVFASVVAVLASNG